MCDSRFDDDDDDDDDHDHDDIDDDDKMVGRAKCVTADLSARASMNRRKSGPLMMSTSTHYEYYDIFFF